MSLSFYSIIVIVKRIRLIAVLLNNGLECTSLISIIDCFVIR